MEVYRILDGKTRKSFLNNIFDFSNLLYFKEFFLFVFILKNHHQVTIIRTVWKNKQALKRNPFNIIFPIHSILSANYIWWRSVVFSENLWYAQFFSFYIKFLVLNAKLFHFWKYQSFIDFLFHLIISRKANRLHQNDFSAELEITVTLTILRFNIIAIA